MGFEYKSTEIIGKNLEKVSADLAQIAVNAYSNGVVKTDQTKAVDNLTKINNLLTQGDVYLPEGDVYIDGTIAVPNGRKLLCTPKTKIYQLSTTLDTITIDDKSVLLDINLEMPSSYTARAISLINHDKAVYNGLCENININFKDSNGTGIYLEAIKDSLASICYIFFYRFTNININLGNKGIHIKDTQHHTDSTRGVVNGCIFNKLSTWRTLSPIYLEGYPGGNIFTEYQLQYNSSGGQRAIYCEGYQNMFSGQLHDWTKEPFEFAATSWLNNVNINLATPQEAVIDKGRKNVVFGGDFPKNLSGWDSYQYDSRKDVLNKDVYPFFFGSQDDCLAYSGEVASLANLGIASTSGNLPALFLPTKVPTGGITYPDPEPNPIIIEIDYSSIAAYLNPASGLVVLGINFGASIAEDFKIEYSTSTTYSLLKQVTGNNKSNFIMTLGGLDIKKLKITITKALSSATVNTAKNVSIRRIYGMSLQRDGNTYLNRGNNDVYGNLTFKQGTAPIIKSPNGTKYKLQVSDTGTLSAIQV